MSTLRATAYEIKQAIIDFVLKTGNVTPSEIYVPITNSFPLNNHYEIRYIVKELQKEKTLVPDIIYGGLRVSQN